VLKALLSELARVLGHVICTETVSGILKPLDSFDQTPRGLFREKKTCDLIDDSFQRAAALVRDDWTSRRLRLDVGDSKILLRCADKASCMTEKMSNSLLRLVSQKFNVCCSALL